MPLSPIAQRIWNMCEEYVPLALEHLNFEFPEYGNSSDTKFHGGAEAKRIHFLFPGIAEKGFTALIQLRMERWRLKSTLRFDEAEKSAQSASGVEHIEAFYEDAAKTVLQFIDHVSKVQQEIIREHFLIAAQ